MNRLINMFLLFFMFIFLLMPQAEAWSITTHYAMVDEIYYSLSPELQSKLSLEDMRDGADDPDVNFLDFSYHSYPANQVKVDYWLAKGKEAYQNGDYKYASYCMGVASHYITDGFCAPHCQADCDSVSHTIYEARAMFLKPHLTYSYYDLPSVMSQGKEEGKKNWTHYVEEDNNTYIIQEDMDKAVSAAYLAIENCLQ